MKLVRYQAGTEIAVGALIEHEAHSEVRRTPWASFEQIFAEADPNAVVLDFDVDGAEPVTVDRILAPTVYRPQVIGVGGNYPEHSAEGKAVIDVAEPVFIPFLAGAVIGPSEAIVIPSAETLTDYEVEFSVVIARTAKKLTEENAMDYVFGYTIVNDVSAREVVIRERMQMMLSKSPDTFVPVGPCVVTKDEIIDPYALRLTTVLNGVVRQDAVTGTMTTRIPALLAFLTQSVTLHAGDIVTTGTPGGVGYFRTPQEFMHPGDTISATVEGIGALTNPLVKGW